MAACAEHVISAIDGASNGPVDEGSVRAGTRGCQRLQGWNRRASRVTPPSWRLDSWRSGQANFGQRQGLTIDGVKVGEALEAEESAEGSKGST
jgi:L-aminopeptidase/D-esterase-like protein